MTGEVKVGRSKSCLSRNKRCKPKKLTENDHNSDEVTCTSGRYTAVRSKQSALIQPDDGSTDDTSGISDNCVEGVLTAGTSGDQKSDAYDFCDDEGIVEESRSIHESGSNKRKRIDSEELEPSGFTNVVSKFKRSRNALNNLKQPSICLENCKDVIVGSKCGRNRTDTCISERNKKETVTKALSMTEASLQQLHKEDIIADDALSTVNDQKQNSENHDKVDNVHEGKTDGKIKSQENSEDSSRNQVCPVCNFKFSSKDEMDVINEHINSCLDRGCDGSNRENVLSDANCESIGEDLFFCQLCQKDLSRMNSQRRQQHINRCCDQAGKAEEMLRSSTVQPQPQCPICSKGFKSSKSRHSHLKKCAQEFNFGTSQLIEIVNREKRQEESTSPAVTTEANTTLSTNVQPARNSAGVKRKRRGATNERDLDEETQLALALSASMVPPLLSAPPVKKGGKGRGKKNQGGSELPALLLRDDETAQRAVALRAAQVLCTQEGNDEDDEISCTPALAPSRLAQNIPACQPVDLISEEIKSKDFVDGVLVDSEVDNTAKSSHKVEEDNLMDVHSGNESEEESRKSVGVTAVVDPLLSRSFLNFLYDVEFEESQPGEMKPPETSHLWSLAAAKDKSSTMFYVPGLLPPVSPRRQQNLPNKVTLSESSATCKESVVQKKLHEQVDDNEETKKLPSYVASERTGETVAQLQLTTTENDELPDITPSQAANVEMLLELAGEVDISNVSMDSQQMITASGFCIDEQEEEDVESVNVPSGVASLLQDLSSMINNPYLSDVVVNLKDGHEIAAHSFILSLRSEVLAQLLKERKALQEKSLSGRSLDRVSLKFEEIDRSAFEVVLKHIYTGDVIIPEHCQLDDVTSLAERFKLPCLLTACKKTQLRLKQALESVDDDETDDFIATDVAQVEQDVWKSDNDDDNSEHVQTTNNKDDEYEDDFLNDDDIEEIVIFQTQSLQRKGSEKGVDDTEDEKSKHLPSVDTKEEVISTVLTCNHKPRKFVDDVSGDKPCSLFTEETEQNLRKPLENDVSSCCPVGKGNVSRNPWEKDDLSGSPVHVEGGSVSRNLLDKDDLPGGPVVEGNASSNPLEKDDLSVSPVHEQSLSRNRIEKSKLSQNPGGNGGNLAEEEQKVSCPKEQLVEEDVIITNEQLPLREESASRKQLRNKKDYFKGNQLLSCDDNVKSCASSIERTRVQEGEPISDSDDVEARPEEQESSEGRTVKRDLEKSYDVVKEVSHAEGTAEVDFELQNDADCSHIYSVSADLLNAENQMEYGDSKKENVSEETQNNVRDLNLDKNRESNKRLPDEPLSLPPGDGRWDGEEVFQGSPGEISMPYDVESDDEMEEMALNESITLISDNEEEVLDVSPPKTDVTIVPETPHVRGRISTKSSSTLSVSEEDDISVTGSSPSKSRKELNKEANEFLSKLKQRAERGKGQKQSKKTAKKNCGAKRSPAEIPPKQTTPTKSSPVRDREAQIGISPLSSPRHSNPPTASPLQMSPRGTKSRSHSPTPWMSPRVCNSPGVVATQTSRVCKSPIGSLMQTPPGDCKSPRGFNPRSISPIAVVNIGNSSPVSPDLHQPLDSPCNSQTKEKEQENVTDLYGRDSLGGKEFDYGEPDDVEIVEPCADKTEGGVCEYVALSPSSSAPEVMSPPVPSPSYSFLDHVSSPGSPVPYTSPPPEKSVSLSHPVSPGLPLGWNSPASEKKLDAPTQPNSPVSPSVCSYRPQITRDLCSQVSRKDAVKNLDFERRLDGKEKPRNAEVVEIDPNVPLMERLKAARGGELKIFSLREDEGNCDTNSDNCTRNEVKAGENSSSISAQRKMAPSPPPEMNLSMSAEFDFYDDGGFNYDLDELNNLEGGMEDGSTVIANKESHSKKGSNEGKVTAVRKGSKQVAGKRTTPLSQRRGQDTGFQQAPSKRGKKTDTHSGKPTGQTVAQPVTPMPNYNEMATPVLKTELHKFGVRPLPKKKMILKLREIYDYTHQVEPGPQESKMERAPSKGQPLPSNVAISDTADGVEGSGTASSDNSDEEETEFGDCTVMIDDEVITASQQVNGGNLKERLVHYFRNKEGLYKKVLRYQPLELVSLQQQIKSDGINCPLGKLVDFLDQQGVTFTTAGSRARAPKKRGRKKKGDYAKPS